MNALAGYRAFLEAKAKPAPALGFEVDPRKFYRPPAGAPPPRRRPRPGFKAAPTRVFHVAGTETVHPEARP